MGVTNHTLVKIAALGGMATVTMGLLTRSKFNDRISETEYYKEALTTIRTHKGAVHILGEPIKTGTIDVGNVEKNYTNDLSAKYEVPVIGSKERGTMHFWAKRKSVDDKWFVNRIELGLKNEPNRRLLVINKD